MLESNPLRSWSRRLMAVLAASAILPSVGLAQDAIAAREHVQSGAKSVRVKVISSRNDMVSGGDALIEVALADAALGPVKLSVNGVDQSAALRQAPGVRTYRALVTGLKLGANRIEANDAGRPAAAAARLAVTNYPAAGPIFTGPKEALRRPLRASTPRAPRSPRARPTHAR